MTVINNSPFYGATGNLPGFSARSVSTLNNLDSDINIITENGLSLGVSGSSISLTNTGVRLINGLSGAIDLVAGTAVNFNIVGNTLTINSSDIILPGASYSIGGAGILVTQTPGSTAATISNIGVLSYNGITGNIGGVSGAIAGAGISLSAATGAVTISNFGVLSFNGNTGAVAGASLGANTFTGTQTASGFVGPLTGTASNASALGGTGADSWALKKNSVASFNGLIGAVGGVTTSVANTFTLLNTFNAGISASGATFTGNITAPNIVASFNGNTGAVAGASLGANTFTGLNTFAAGISATGATFTGNITAPNIVASFNGKTGAVGISAGSNVTIAQSGNASTGFTYTITAGLAGEGAATNVANTFTEINRFTKGISASGATFTGNIIASSTTIAESEAFTTQRTFTQSFGATGSGTSGVTVVGDAWLIGSFSDPNSIPAQFKFVHNTHTGNNLQSDLYEWARHYFVDAPANSTTFSDWVELPVSISIAYAATRYFRFDVRKKQSGEMQLRMRATVATVSEGNHHFTFTTTGNTIYTPAAGGSTTTTSTPAPTGFHGRQSYEFPVSKGNYGFAGSTAGVFILNSGNVGIGTLTPTVALDVLGAGKFTAGISATGATFTDNITISSSGFSGPLAGTASNASALGGTAATDWVLKKDNVAKITASTGISIVPTGGTGNITISNTGVQSISAGTGISISQTVGAVTINSTGTFNENIVFSGTKQGLVGRYDATKTQAIWAMDPVYTLGTDTSSASYASHYGLAWSYEPDHGTAGNNPQSKANLSHQLLLQHNGVTKTAIGTGIWTSGTITARDFNGIVLPASGVAQQIHFGSGGAPALPNSIQFPEVAALPYSIYREGGAWVNPYPDLVISYHTGIKLIAYESYGGTRFYSNYNAGHQADDKILLSVGNGDVHVRVGSSTNTTSNLIAYGKVGIGVAAPLVALDVAGAINASTTLSSNSKLIIAPQQFLAAALISTDTTASIVGSSVTAGNFNGTLGLYGTNGLAVGNGGGIMFGGAYNNSNLNLLTAWAEISGVRENSTDGSYDGALVFKTRPSGGNAFERVRITSTGKVGIGVAAPLVALDVVGEARSSIGTTAGSNTKTLVTKDYVENLNRLGSVICCLITYPDSSSSTHLSRYGITKTANTLAFTLPTGNWTGCIIHASSTTPVSNTNSSGISSVLLGGGVVTTYSNTSGTLTGAANGATPTNNNIAYWNAATEAIVINLVRTG